MATAIDILKGQTASGAQKKQKQEQLNELAGEVQAFKRSKFLNKDNASS